MVKKLTRGQKAWATRKANAKKKSNKAITAAALGANWKVDSSKDLLKAQSIINKMRSNHDPSDIGKTLRIKFPADFKVSENEMPFLTPYEQLDKAIEALEIRILNTVAHIKSLGI